MTLVAVAAVCLTDAAILRAQDVPPAVSDKLSKPATEVVVPRHPIAAGPFEPTWDSLGKGYRAPEWFRDAKFGIWAHWSAQSVPEMGDWYARRMYLPEEEKWGRQKPVFTYDFHVKTYGHPSKVGFMEIENLWKAEKWEPEKLMDLYQRAGAKYFVAMANHHDNFDAYESKHHAWNSVNVGPRRDVVGDWQKAALARGLRFGVSNHSSHAWHWYQAAYGYDPEGEIPGARFDAFTLRKEDGKGKWWEGLDPQELYTGPQIVMPDGFKTRKEAAAWRAANNKWQGDDTPNNPKFISNWFLRAQDLIDSYRPDFVFLDNAGLPFGATGLDFAAHFYNASLKWNDGKMDAVITTNAMDQFPPEHRYALVGNRERFGSDEIRPEPWQTGTCIGSWHYERSRLTNHQYDNPGNIIRMLTDIVSKNGNLLLSIPQRGDGTIDEEERKILESIAAWMAVNSECIFGTRPWKIYGEGPSVDTVAERRAKGAKAGSSLPATAEDFRFTTKGETLYAITPGWPKDGRLLVKSLGKTAPHTRAVKSVHLLGAAAPLQWSQNENGLEVQLPATAPSEHAYALKID
ncbi:MAG TPA: alpha-L-fucosidase [Chthoniobacteraceae bacterium]